ncbi:MAG: hypothetical protein SFZ24_04240 [Planctomycetota bacterium]|nr:hypothetical protein [Planctomycetota bacterium]
MTMKLHGSVARLGMSGALVLALAAGTTAQTTGASSAASAQPSGQGAESGSSGAPSKDGAPAPQEKGGSTPAKGRAASGPATFTKGGAKGAEGAGAEANAAASGAVSLSALGDLIKHFTPGAPNGKADAGAAGGEGDRPGARPSGPQFPEDVPVYDGQPEAAASGEAGEEDGVEPNVSVSEYLTVDMFVQDEDLANVLQMLSLQSRRNIVASKDVAARVTANLYGVTFYEALDSILHVNGYGYIEKGSFIYVYTLDELQQIKAAERQVVSKVMRLNYLNANDAAEFVAPLLSEKGQIKTNGDVGSFTIPENTPTGDEQFALASTLVIFDYEENIAEIEKLLENLDTKPAQVLVEATILQTTLTEANAFGVDFAVLDSVDMTDFLDLGGILGSANQLNQGSDFVPSDGRGSAIVGTPGNTGGRGTFKLSILHDDLGIFIRALDEVSDVSVVSNPKVLALNRQPAKVSIGQKIGYLKSTTNNGVTEQDVDFLPTGTSLAFRPFISKDGLIRMELKPKVSEARINEFTDNEGRTVTVPDEVSQEVTTNVIVPDGSTVVLGGLFREETRLARSQVPIIGDIPILGTAFRGHDDSTNRFEVIFLIKPTIMNDNVLLSQGEKAVSFTEHVRTGSRQGLLPWSRERQTAQLNVRAEKLAAEGKTDQALNALRRSLELNPQQPDAYRLQERLSGEAKRWPRRHMLQSVVEEAAQERARSTPAGEPAGHGVTEGAPAALSTPEFGPGTGPVSFWTGAGMLQLENAAMLPSPAGAAGVANASTDE